MTERLFRCTGDVQFDDSAPVVGQVADVRLKPFSETCNYLQYQKPLTKEKPCFFAQIRSLCGNSVVALGIAGSDIADEVHSGNWNGSVGYRNTGRCYASHQELGHTDGEKFGVGDIFGVMVTYFGKKYSTVVFLRNGTPVATRYLFSADHSQYLPTVSFQNGPIEMGLLWPDSCMGIPNYSEKNMLNWIRASSVHYLSKEDLFCVAKDNSEPHIIQSPVPLSSDILHYEAIVKDASPEGVGPITAIASCSPMSPRPTLEIMHDYFKWVPDGKEVKTKIGERIGFGIHYNPKFRDLQDFDDKAEQPVLCYVSKNMTIEFAKMMMQPEGGWYPAVVLNALAKKVQIDVKTNRKPLAPDVIDLLDKTFNRLLIVAENVISKDKLLRELKVAEFRHTPEFKVEDSDTYTKITLPKDKKGIHVFQLCKPLTKEQSYFCFEVKKIGDSSVVCAGIAGQDFPLNRYPGRLLNSVGYHSRDGKLYYNDKFSGNMMGKRYRKGELIGIEVDVLRDDLSVVLFRKNHQPVGTRYHTHKDRNQLLPTIAICTNGSEVELNIVFQNRVPGSPILQVNNIEHWCVPEMARLETPECMVYVEPGHAEVEAIQAPYSLDRVYNHFEVELLDEVDENTPPPAIALCTASPMDPPPRSNFKQDFLRFWATGEARKAVKKGDLMGWGLLYPDVTLHPNEEQLVICYLSINRDVALTRVMYQPPGGFYPVVLLPAGVDRVKLNFGATIIKEHPFTQDAIKKLLKEAKEMIALENKRLSQGADPEEWDTEENKGKYLKPVPVTATNINKFKEFRDKFSVEELDRLRNRPSKIENLVEMMIEQNKNKKAANALRKVKEDRIEENGRAFEQDRDEIQNGGLNGQTHDHGLKTKMSSKEKNHVEKWRNPHQESNSDNESSDSDSSGENYSEVKSDRTTKSKSCVIL